MDGAAIAVMGVSERWRVNGLGDARRAVVDEGRPPVLLVHSGPRPGGLAPKEELTRFTWTVERGQLQDASTNPVTSAEA